MQKLHKYLKENREVDHTELPGLIGQWVFKNKLKVFDYKDVYEIRRAKKLDSRDLDVLILSGLVSIQGAGGSSLVITVKK